MGHFSDGLRALTTTIKNVFRTPTTVHYPAQKRERSERYRNTFALLHDAEGDELCVGCLQCERICPSQVITVIAEKKESPVTGKRRGYATDFVLDLNACIYCELCVQVCPTDAIVMTRTAETPGYSREELCLTMDRLYENETQKPLTWGTASKLMEMQDPKRGQPPPEKKPTKPAAAKPAKPTAEKPAAEKPTAEKPAAAQAKTPAPTESKAAPAGDRAGTSAEASASAATSKADDKATQPSEASTSAATSKADDEATLPSEASASAATSKADDKATQPSAEKSSAVEADPESDGGGT